MLESLNRANKLNNPKNILQFMKVHFSGTTAHVACVALLQRVAEVGLIARFQTIKL